MPCAKWGAEGRVARIMPHAEDELAVIEVVAISLNDIPEDDIARLAVQLLRLNHEARFEHGWSIALDDADGLNVTTTVSVAGTQPSHLAEILYDGIGRAASLSAVVSGLIGAAEAAAAPAETSPIVGAGAIRG
jgi:hypothetical protein